MRTTFTTPFEQYRAREGQAFTVVRKITEADLEHDEESLPMYVIRFEDGAEIEAWPIEVEESRETLDAVRALGDQLNRTPCAFVGATKVSCVSIERTKGGKVRPFQDRDPRSMCASCAASWYIEMAALVLEGRL
jgi:hypothetical protein